MHAVDPCPVSVSNNKTSKQLSRKGKILTLQLGLLLQAQPGTKSIQ